jgi:hypothetical protein
LEQTGWHGSWTLQSTEPKKPVQPLAPAYGGQLTFFYRGASKMPSSDAGSGVLMHAAISNTGDEKHEHASLFEVWSPEGLSGLLGYARSEGPGAGPDVALGSNSLAEISSSGVSSNGSHSQTSSSQWWAEWSTPRYQVRLGLTINGDRLWPHGKKGFVQKTERTGNTYTSIPFVPARGTILDRMTGQAHQVCGSLWFDHEVDVQEVEKINWQWFALRFPDGRAYMLYRIVDGASVRTMGETTGTANETKLLETVVITPADDVCLKSGNCYPQSFVISFVENGQNRTLRIRSRFPEQEVISNIGKTYWEGIVDVTDEKGAMGLGFVEMTK